MNGMNDVFEPMFQQLENNIPIKLPADEMQHLRGRMRQRLLPKGKYLLQEGDVCRYMGYMVSGAGRIYSIDNKGAEHTMGLYTEGDWVFDYESFFLQTESRYYIEMEEKSRVLLLSNSDRTGLPKTAPVVWEALRVMEQELHIASLRRLHASMSLSAAERYEELKHHRPVVIARFPQCTIASFLGITAETLSRIRRQGKACPC